MNIGSFGGTQTYPDAINRQGDIVGYSTVNNYEHAFIYSGGRMTYLGTFGGDSSEAYGVNDSGTAVGGADLSGKLNRGRI